MSPVRTCWPMVASPKTTSPVAIPVRTTRRTPQVCVEPVVQGGQRALGLGGRLDRAQGVVIVADREPEDGHDRVADDLLDRAAVRLEDQPHLIEVEGQDLAERLRIEALAERRRTLEVGVHDGREAPDLDRPSLGLPRRSTRSAAPISVRDRGAAGRAGRGSHPPESSGRGAASRSPVRQRARAGVRWRTWFQVRRMTRSSVRRSSSAGCSPGSTRRRWTWSLGALRARRFRRGEVIFHGGRPGRLAVHRGEWVGQDPGRPGRTAASRRSSRPSVPAASSASWRSLDGRARSATAVAVERVETLVLHRDAFDRLIDEEPAITPRAAGRARRARSGA